MHFDDQQDSGFNEDEGFDEEEEENADNYGDDSGLLADPAAVSAAAAPQSGWAVLDRAKLEKMQVGGPLVQKCRHLLLPVPCCNCMHAVADS